MKLGPHLFVVWILLLGIIDKVHSWWCVVRRKKWISIILHQQLTDSEGRKLHSISEPLWNEICVHIFQDGFHILWNMGIHGKIEGSLVFIDEGLISLSKTETKQVPILLHDSPMKRWRIFLGMHTWRGCEEHTTLKMLALHDVLYMSDRMGMRSIDDSDVCFLPAHFLQVLVSYDHLLLLFIKARKCYFGNNFAF